MIFQILFFFTTSIFVFITVLPDPSNSFFAKINQILLEGEIGDIGDFVLITIGLILIGFIILSLSSACLRTLFIGVVEENLKVS
jgi:hypothetical protein